MHDLPSSFFVQFAKIHLTENESASCKDAILTFVSHHSVRKVKTLRLTSVDQSTSPVIGLTANVIPLLSEEKEDMLEDLRAFMRHRPLRPSNQTNSRAPLFFGTWSGTHLLRIVKPFFLTTSAK